MISLKIKCAQSRVATSHRVLQGDLNEHGTVFGGLILKIVDAEASIAAMRVAKTPIVTAGMDHLQFIRPFKLQDALEMEAYVTGIGHRSIEVFVKVIGEHLLTGERFLGFTCFVTYVIENHQQQCPYNGVETQTSEERQIVAGYQQRRQQRRANRHTQQKLLQAIDLY